MTTRSTDGWEYRALGSVQAGDGRTLRGYAVVFNRLSEDLGGFQEQVAPEAVNRTLRELSRLDPRALFNHDSARVLGRVSAGTLRLVKDTIGLGVEIEPPDPTDPVNLLESVRRRDITGMSFGFRTLEDRWDFKVDPPIRTLLDMEIREVSVVAFPAYSDTSVAVRSLDDAVKAAGIAWKPSMKFRERLLRLG